jgi:hypothetical protein
MGARIGSRLAPASRTTRQSATPTAREHLAPEPLSQAVLGLQRTAGNRAVGALLRRSVANASQRAPSGSLAAIQRAVASDPARGSIQRQPPDQDPQIGPGLPQPPTPFMFNFGGSFDPKFTPSAPNWQLQIPGLGKTPQIPADPTQIPGQIQGLLPGSPGGSPGGPPPMLPGLPGATPPGGTPPLNLSCPPGQSNPLGLGCAPDPTAPPQPSDPSLLPPLTMPSFPGLPAPAAPSLGVPPLTMPPMSPPTIPTPPQDDSQTSQ